MPEHIDYRFLSDLEGGSKTTGYVPAASLSISGVTIAAGFDLRQRGESDMISLKLDAPLITKLKPYLGAKGASAQALLKKPPLMTSLGQTQAIDKAVKTAYDAQLKLKYDSVVGSINKFVDLPPQAQTVITSVSFQYGIGFSFRTPKFWTAVTSHNWPESTKLLKACGDAYPTRRNREADLLETIK